MTSFHGIVLYTRQYKDNDLLVRVLTETEGLRTFLARGAKKQKSKLPAGVQTYTLSLFEGALPKQNGSLGYINDVQDTKQYTRLIKDIEANAYVAVIASLLDAAFEDGEPITHWYQQFVIALDKINNGADPQIITNIFEVQLLVPLGVAPNWRADPIDGNQVGIFDYSEKYNGIISENHFGLDEHRLHVDAKTIFYLRQFSTINLAQVGHIKVSNITKRGLQQVIDYIYDRQVGFKPRAKRFIEQMHSWTNQLKKLRRTDN